jgi:hypothetical protein
MAEEDSRDGMIKPDQILRQRLRRAAAEIEN